MPAPSVGLEPGKSFLEYEAQLGGFVSGDRLGHITKAATKLTCPPQFVPPTTQPCP